MPKSIISIEFVADIETDPDLSYLGKYGSTRDSEMSIDRETRGDRGRGEYRYFTPALSGKETGNPDSPEQDYQRMEDYNKGEWHMCHCYARALVSIAGVRQEIVSGGLSGVESDSDKKYFEEIMAEELISLASILRDIGFKASEIKEKTKNACIPF